MAATDARPIPLKNTAFRMYFEIIKNDGTLITSWAAADTEVSLDGAAFADCTNEATEIGSSGIGYIDLTSSEMNADCVIVKTTVTNTGALVRPYYLYPEETGDIRVNATQISGDTTAADNAESFFDGTGYAGTNNVIPTVTTATNVTAVNGLAAGVITDIQNGLSTLTAAQVNAEVDTALADYDAPTNAEMVARTLAAADYATAAALNTVDDLLDTEVSAIKAKTDQLTFTGSDVNAAVSSVDVDEEAIADAVVAQLGSASVEISSPVNARGEVEIVQGDDYSNSDARALTFNFTGVPSLVDATVVMRIMNHAMTQQLGSTWTGTVIDADSVRFEPTSEQTAAVLIGKHRFEIEATLATNGRKVTLVALENSRIDVLKQTP